jgi:hypothetical protein
MEDKAITIVFGSLGATLALVSVLFAYLQLRGFRPAIAPDEEQVVPLDGVAQEEPVIGPPAVVVQQHPVTSPPYASCLPTQLYHRTDNLTGATPKTDMPSAIDCRRDSTDIATSWSGSKRMGLVRHNGLRSKTRSAKRCFTLLHWVGQVYFRRESISILFPSPLFPSCSLKLQLDPNVAAAAESDSASWIDIVISHMYPAGVQSVVERKKEERTPRRCPKSYN